jgi:hypothetical protein
MLEVHVGARRPEPRLKVLSGDYLAGVFQEHGKHADWLAGEFDPKAVLPQFARLDMELKCSKPENPAGGARVRPGCHARHLFAVRFYTC